MHLERGGGQLPKSRYQRGGWVKMANIEKYFGTFRFGLWGSGVIWVNFEKYFGTFRRKFCEKMDQNRQKREIFH